MWSVQPQYDAWDNPGQKRGEATAGAITRCGQALELKASFLGLIYLPEAL